MSTTTADVKRAGIKFLMEAELSRHYKRANMMSGMGGLPAPNPILDMLLPSLLYVRLGSLVDEALEEYLDSNGLTIGRGYKNDFNGRIRTLSELGTLNDAAKLHAIRKQRNLLAHEAKESCTWQVLNDAIDAAQVELEHLGLVGPRPAYEFFGERSALKESSQGKGFAHDFRYGLKENGMPVIDVSWGEVTYGGGDEDQA